MKDTTFRVAVLALLACIAGTQLAIVLGVPEQVVQRGRAVVKVRPVSGTYSVLVDGEKKEDPGEWMTRAEIAAAKATPSPTPRPVSPSPKPWERGDKISGY